MWQVHSSNWNINIISNNSVCMTLYVCYTNTDFQTTHKYQYPAILKHLIYLFKNCWNVTVLYTFPFYTHSSPKVSNKTQYSTTFLHTLLCSIPQLTACTNAWLALMAVAMNITVFWCVMTRTIIASQQCYTEMCCLHLQGTRVIEAAHCSETLVTCHQSTWLHILEDNNLHLHVAKHGNIFWQTL